MLHRYAFSSPNTPSIAARSSFGFRLDQWKNDADESRQKVVFVADEVQFITLPAEAGEVAADAEDFGDEEEFDETDDLGEEEEAPVARSISAARSNNPRRSARAGSGHSARRGAARRATRTSGARR